MLESRHIAVTAVSWPHDRKVKCQRCGPAHVHWAILEGEGEMGRRNNCINTNKNLLAIVPVNAQLVLCAKVYFPFISIMLQCMCLCLVCM